MAENNNSCCPPAENPTKPLDVAAPCCPPASKEQSCCSQEPVSDSCCPPSAADTCCPPGESQAEIAGYSIYPFVNCWLKTPIGQVPQIATQLTWTDRRGSWAMRWGIGRDRYQVTPGVYAVGQPDEKSPLLISANYKLSFDCLRAALNGLNAWILVIDTKGVNVWCAAGKGTFGTDEIVRRCQSTRVDRLVCHRQLIVPQLGAPGVAAYKVKQETGFSVIYGPVRAGDLKAFLRDNLQATPKMRQTTFSIWERLILTPVEVTVLRKPIFISIMLLFVLSGIGADIFSFSAAWQRGLAAAAAGITGVISGCVLTPILLPWLPTRAFAAKGALLGLISATVLYLGPYRAAEPSGAVSLYLLVIAVSSYTAMNFTGSTTFTSPSGVEKEMRIAIPCQVLALLVAGLLWIGAAF
jgi:hypothetical protein